MRKVFLDDLPKYGFGLGSGRGVAGTINWKKSIGNIVHFVYDNIEGNIEIIGYNQSNRNIILQYKNNNYEMTACAFRECRLGGLLKNEFVFQYNENLSRRIDLRNLPRSFNGIDWKKSIGEKFYFYYDDLDGYIEIIDYVSNKQMLTLRYNNKINTIKTQDILNCKIGNIIGKWNTDFIYKVGDIIITNHCILEILDCIRKYEKSHKGYMKWYRYKCTQCGWDAGEIRENDLKKKTKGTCPKCGDGHSFPNKVAFNLLSQLNINFIPEYSPDWIKPKRYDFYFELNNNKYIIEMDGGFHKIDNYLSGNSAEKIKKIDEYKNNMALLHNIKMIRIDCSISDLDFIKNNILNSELNNILSLDNINWIECQKFASHSRIYEACKIYNENNNLSPKEIGLQMKLSNTTVRKFLKIGNQLGVCDYNVDKVCKDRAIKAIKSVITKRSKKVICLNTLEIFNSISIANLYYNCCKISECCSGKRLSSGKHPITGEPLKWMFYDDYIKLQNNNMEECI